MTNKFSFLSSFVLNLKWREAGNAAIAEQHNFPISWEISHTETWSFVRNRWHCFIIAKTFSWRTARVISFESTVTPRNSIFWQGWSTVFLTFIRNLTFCNAKSIYPLHLPFLFVNVQLTECRPEWELSIYSTSWELILGLS